MNERTEGGASLLSFEPIAYLRCELTEKFGVPRQSGLAPSLRARVEMTGRYAVPEAFRGLEGFSHIWLIWNFSKAVRDEWSPTVRPPRLGGNIRLGVFATRSPFRPNPIGLSCVRIERLSLDGPVPELIVTGADLMDGTPILDIKPYVPYADSVPDAAAGFTAEGAPKTLPVVFPDIDDRWLTAERKQAISEVLGLDPRPAYHDEPDRIYGMAFGERDVRFTVDGERVRITSIEKR